MTKLVNNENLFKVLNQFLTPNFHLTSETYLELLIGHLAKPENKDLTQLPLVAKWIVKSIDQIDSNQPQKIQVYAFTLRLLAIVIENDSAKFELFQTKDIFNKIKESIKKNNKIASPSVKLGHVSILKTILKSSAGLQWITSYSGWMQPIDYCIENQTVYVVREAQQFTKEIIFKSFYNLQIETISRDILTYSAEPIKDAVIVYRGIVCIDSADLQRKVSPTISLLCIILNDCIRASGNYQIIANNTIEIFNAEINLWRLISMTKNPNFFKEIMLAHVYVNCAQIANNLSEFYQRFFDHINYCIANTNPLAMIAVANLYQNLYHSGLKMYLSDESLNLEYQIFVIIFVPIIYLIGEHEKCMEYRKFNQLLMKCYGYSLEQLQNRCANLHEYFSNNKMNLESTCSNAIQIILEMRTILQDNQLKTIFEIFVKILEYVDIELLLNLPKFLSSILTALHTMIKMNSCFMNGNILLRIMLELLSNDNLECRLNVQILSILQCTVETQTNHNFDEYFYKNIGSILMKRLHDSNWEVKDSTIEVVTAMMNSTANNSFILNSISNRNDICVVITDLYKHDAEPFVRATSLRCIGFMIKNICVWEDFVQISDLLIHLLNNLQNESEGIVRKEIVFVVQQIFLYHSINANELNLLLSSLAHTAINDLHWEVKIAALDFWKILIEKQLHSKSLGIKSKTVILEDLSVQGIFGILLECLQDEDSDAVCIKKIVEVVKKLLNIFDESDFIKKIDIDQKLITDEPVNTTSSYCNKTLSNNSLINKNTELIDNDEIIESICQSKDLNLLTKMMQIKSDLQTIDEMFYKQFCNVKANDFLQKISTLNLDELIDNRSDWIIENSSFNSLLDDMMYSLQINDVNNIECY